MNLLVTGGGGFLGAWIVKRLSGAGHRIRILEASANRQLLSDIAGPANAATVDWLVGDVVEGADVHRAVAGCDAIVHLAGVLTPACKADPVRGAKINLIGTLNVFEAARAHGVERIVYTSSAAAHGPKNDPDPRPISHYGAFKVACEGCARAYWQDHRLGSVGFRPYVVYGPGRETGLTAGPSLACRAAARGEAYTIPYSGSSGLVYVDDVAAAYEAALTREPDGAHVFDLAGEVASNERVVEEIRRVVPQARIGVAGPIAEFVPHAPDASLDKVLPGLPRTSLRDGVARTIAFYRRAELEA